MLYSLWVKEVTHTVKSHVKDFDGNSFGDFTIGESWYLHKPVVHVNDLADELKDLHRFEVTLVPITSEILITRPDWLTQ